MCMCTAVPETQQGGAWQPRPLLGEQPRPAAAPGAAGGFGGRPAALECGGPLVFSPPDQQAGLRAALHASSTPAAISSSAPGAAGVSAAPGVAGFGAVHGPHGSTVPALSALPPPAAADGSAPAVAQPPDQALSTAQLRGNGASVLKAAEGMAAAEGQSAPAMRAVAQSGAVGGGVMLADPQQRELAVCTDM